VNTAIGNRDFKYMGNICPYTQVTWYGAYAVAETHCQWWPVLDVITRYNSRTDWHRIFKLGGHGGLVHHMTFHECTLLKVKRLKVKVTRTRNISAVRTLYLGNGWSYQLQTWWKLSTWGETGYTQTNRK